MTKKCLRRSLGLCLTLTLALGSVTALGAGYGSIGLETTNVSGDLFNGTGSFETGIPSTVGGEGKSNLSEGWKVYKGRPTSDGLKVVGDVHKNGTHSVYIQGSNYITPDDGVVKNIVDKNGFNGKYTVSGSFMKNDVYWPYFQLDLQLGNTTVSDASRPTAFTSDESRWSGSVNGIVSPTNSAFPSGVFTSEQIAEKFKPKNNATFIVRTTGKHQDGGKGPGTWYDLSVTFDGTDKSSWKLLYPYMAYGYKEGKYYGASGKAYDTYVDAEKSDSPMYFEDEYRFSNEVIGDISTTNDTQLRVYTNGQAYIDGITMTFAPVGTVKASDFAGKSMPVITRVYNNAAEASNAVLITALYDSNNMLRGVATDDFSFGANETEKVVSSTIDVPTVLDEGYSIMTYAWKNLDTDITPLATMLNRESGEGNLIENGGFEILPQSKGNTTVAKNWQIWGGGTNSVFETVRDGADGSAYCVKLAQADKLLEYSPDKVTEILNNNGVKGTYTMKVWYKYSGNDYPQLYALLRLGSYDNKNMQQEKSFTSVANTAGKWKCAEFNFTSGGYGYWDNTLGKTVIGDVSAMTNFAGRIYIKAVKTDDVLIDNVSLTFTPDAN